MIKFKIEKRVTWMEVYPVSELLVLLFHLTSTLQGNFTNSLLDHCEISLM